jgi:hypothetical protein
VRELIDRIDEMSLRGVKLCNRYTEKHPGEWQGKPGKAQCAECDSECRATFRFARRLRLWRGTAVSARADERRLEDGDGAQQVLEEWNVADRPEIDSLPEADKKLVNRPSQFATK